MKGKLLLLLGIGFIPLALTGQTTPYLYNKGIMSVKTGDNTKTALYVGGDFMSETSGVMYLDKAKVVLTGDLYRNSSVSTIPVSTAHVFNIGTDYSSYSTLANQSSLWFKGSRVQNVWKGKPAAGKAYNEMNFKEKSDNVINFPNIVVDNDKHVVIHPEIAAKTYNVNPLKGRLILDSRKLDKAGLNDVLPGGTTIHSDNSSSVLAHLLVEGVQDMTQALIDSETDIRALEAYPGVQVNLALDKIKGESDRVKGDAIVGMGSPFQEMRADYFMFNFLFMPTGNSIFNVGNGYHGGTSVDPLEILKPGHGFVIGIDLRGGNAADYKDIHPLYYNYQNGYAIDFQKRVKEKYEFNRFAYGVNPNNLFQVDGNYTVVADAPNNNLLKNVKPSGASAYTGELLNSKTVEVTLVKGYNYLSNPYTCPLDVSKLVFGPHDGATPAGDWNIKPGFTPAVVGAAVGDIANRVWVMDPESVASGTYNIWSGGTANNPGNKWVVAHYKYTLISHLGGTNTNPYDTGLGQMPNGTNKALIAPMQMFLVYANANGVGAKIHIPASERVVDDNVLFLRSDGDNKIEPDDFLFEVEDLDNGTKDRAAIVLRTFSEINDNGYSDVKKLTTDVSSNEDGKARASTSEGAVKTSAMSALYTKDSDGNAIESKFLAIDTNSPTTTTILYLQPSLTKHDITIRSFRNYTKDKISEIVLKDILTNKTIKLSDGAVYTTTSSPTDDPARFQLTFKYSPVGGIGDDGLNPDETNITAYYKDNTLTVSGFNDSDYGSQVSVYDIQGRLIKQSKVDGATVKFNDRFNVGAYIVKVTGSRSYATKFLAR